jgi:hypothetical protein
LSDDIASLEAKVALLDDRIRAWRDKRERAFSAAFAAKEGSLSALMARLPNAATAAARIGAGPQEDAFAVLDRICDDYLRADPARCALIRGVVHQHEIRHLLAEYEHHAAQMLRKGRRPEWLDRALAAASLDDQRVDHRDWLIALGDVYVAAYRADADVKAAFDRAARVSNPERHPAAPTPTREAIARFEQSAYFATSVLPQLR